MENIPSVVDRIAKGLNVTRGQLRQMVLNGKLLSKDTFDALLKQSDDIQKEFDEMPNTMQRGMNTLSISFTQLLGELDDITGATKKAGNTFSWLAGILSTVEQTLKGNNTQIKLWFNEYERVQNLIGSVDPMTSGGIFGFDLQNPFGLLSNPFDNFKRINEEFNRRKAEIEAEAKKNTAAVSDKHGKPDPVVDKAALKKLEKMQQFREELDAETQATKRLLAARQNNEDLYGRMQLLIEVENELRSKNLNLTKQQTEALIQQGFANRKRMGEIEGQGQLNNLNREIEQSVAMIKAIQNGPLDVYNAEKKAFIDNAMAALPAGLSDKTRSLLKEAYSTKFTLGKVESLEAVSKAAKEQLEYQNKLVEAQKLGNAEFIKLNFLMRRGNTA